MDSKKLKNLAKVNGIVGLGGGIFLLFATPITVSADTAEIIVQQKITGHYFFARIR